MSTEIRIVVSINLVQTLQTLVQFKLFNLTQLNSGQYKITT